MTGTSAEKIDEVIQNILEAQLLLEESSELLVIFDETRRELAQVVCEVGYSLGIQPTMIMFPVSFQNSFSSTDDFFSAFLGAIPHADAILTCLTDLPTSTAFRAKIVSFQSRDISIGHTPGIDQQMLLDFFPSSSDHFDQMKRKCQYLTLPLATSSECEIITTDNNGKEYVLELDLGFWKRVPNISDGFIPRGSWGNLMPGETYIAPIEGSANGEILITGSLPNRILVDEEYVLLRFQDGKISLPAQASSPNLLSYFYSQTKEIAEFRNDENWSCLAELGIGVNSKIKRLTGRSILDEKADKTIHIAIGRNTPMGGTIKSEIHCDMIILSPTVLLDGKTLMDNGSVDWDSTQWNTSIENVLDLNMNLSEINSVKRTEVDVDDDVNHLRLLMKSGTNRQIAIDLGAPDLSILAKIVLDEIPSDRPIQFNATAFSDKLSVSNSDMMKALSFLAANEIIAIN